MSALPQVFVSASLHAAAASAGAALKALLSKLSANALTPRSTSPLYHGSAEHRVQKVIRVILNIYSLIEAASLERYPGLHAKFWESAEKHQTLVALTQILNRNQLGGEYQREIAHSVSNAIKVTFYLNASMVEQQVTHRELAKHRRSVIRSGVIQQYAMETLAVLGSKEPYSPELASLFPGIVEGFIDYLSAATEQKCIPEGRMRALVTCEGLFAHLEGFATGRAGFTANKPAKIIRIIFEGIIAGGSQEGAAAGFQAGSGDAQAAVTAHSAATTGQAARP